MPEQRLCVLPHGAVVLVMERVDGPGRGVHGGRGGGGGGGVVVVVMVDRRRLVNRCPVRGDKTRE